MNRFYLISLCVMALCQVSYGQQDRVDEYRMQQEQLKKTMVLRELDSGVYYMDQEQYDLADEKFQFVLENVRSVPSDLTFFFGKNSFYQKKYQQSIDWLNKYIQLKGTNGQYSGEAAQWLKKAETEFMKEKALASVKVAEVLSVNYDIDCGPSGKVTCPVCKGSHVVVKRGALTPEYRTCSYCNEHGLLTCVEYNQLLRGQLKPKN